MYWERKKDEEDRSDYDEEWGYRIIFHFKKNISKYYYK